MKECEILFGKLGGLQRHLETERKSKGCKSCKDGYAWVCLLGKGGPSKTSLGFFIFKKESCCTRLSIIGEGPHKFNSAKVTKFNKKSKYN